jgi:O-acetyl-ADP-ribose deacetylase (regulator of RNase III)
MIHVVKGDATLVQQRPAILVHVVNDVGAWGAGFVLAVSRRWPHVKTAYRKGWRGSHLGHVQFVYAEEGLVVANLFGQRGIRGRRSENPVRYGAIRKGLRKVAERARADGAWVHMPKIGCGLAGGKWCIVSRIIEEEMEGLEVTVYEW